MYGRPNISMMRSFRQDPTVTQQKLKPGTVRRIISYAKPYRLYLSLFLFATVLDALITVVNPLLLRAIIDKGILGHNEALVIGLAGAVAAVAVFDAFLGFVTRWYLRPDRRGPDLRPAHPGIQPRAAAAHRVLHPCADRVTGSPGSTAT